MADLSFLRDDWAAISAHLDEALALPAEARSAWIEALADGEPVKAKLRLLLVEGIETGEFLETLPRMTLPNHPMSGDDAIAGAVVGPYRLLAELGRGGMGAVWLAERVDAQPRRKVALKLPHIGWAPGLAARLARERDILASLEHPHIARLYDAGVDQLGRPYLALEYVDGTPIDRYCGARALSVRERLGLLLQVVAAVAHAHTRLVVHRDLKPSNILVTVAGEVRLLDFGIAKLMQSDDDADAATELTGVAGRPLTPDYASPEQIRGDAIGTASDVYSLGVVAYEVLAGARPYRLKDVDAGSMAAAIDRVDAPLASRSAADAAVRRQLAGDLDAILHKALKKDPADRYPTVVAFADDIERHLRHAPVVARPDRLAYRARKFVARHAVQVGAGALVIVAVLGGASVAVWQARQARFEAARAEQVKDFALSIFEEADSDAGAGPATTAADLLQAAEARIERELAGQPEVAVELMSAVGYSLLGQGRYDAGNELLRKTLERANHDLGPQHPLTLTATAYYAESLLGLKRPSEAVALLLPMVGEARRQKQTRSLIFGLKTLSLAQVDAGDAEASVATARAAVAAVESAAEPVRRLDAYGAWAALAQALRVTESAGQIGAAQQALALARQIDGDRVTENVLFARLALAQALVREKRDTAALRELGDVLDDAARVLGRAHPTVEGIANRVGRTRLDAGDVEGAAAAFRAQLTAAERPDGNRVLSTQMGHYALGIALGASHRWLEAAEQLEASAALADGPGADVSLGARARSQRALLLAREGRLEIAERSFAALADQPWTASDRAAHGGRLAVLRSLQGRHEEAVELAREAWNASRQHPSQLVRANSGRTLGTVLLAAGKFDEALAPLHEAVALCTAAQLLVSPDCADAIAALALAEAHTAPAGVPLAKRD